MASNKDINRLKVVLAEKKRTGKWLAEQLNKDQATISKWCTNNAQPSLEMLLKIAEVLEVDVKELSDRQYLMLRFITLDDTITIDEMMQKMKVSPITVKRDLADLQTKGIIAREGGRKNGRWVIQKQIK